ncbi:MAG: Dabb family protein [Bacteroidaceae bacterium]|nr:Dabb family protein [Bacteroidaceae bacterium]
MISHTVMFRLRTDLSDAERLQAAVTFKRDIEALPALIPTIRSIRVGLNINPAEQWHICLVSEFDTLSDVATYAAHPAHVSAAARLKPAVAERACADCEF